MPSQEEWAQLHQLRENLEAARAEVEGGGTDSTDESGSEGSEETTR